MKWKDRFKNPYFWIGLVAMYFATLGVEPSTMTSWSLLITNIKDTLLNPFSLGCIVVATIGYINDPTTPGLKDKRKDVK